MKLPEVASEVASRFYLATGWLHGRLDAALWFFLHRGSPPVAFEEPMAGGLHIGTTGQRARLLALLGHHRERRACAPVVAHEEARQLLPGAGSSSSQAPGPPAAGAASRGHGIVWDRLGSSGIVWDRSEFGLLPVDGSRGHLRAPLDALIKYRLTPRTSHLGAEGSAGGLRWT